MVYVYRYAFNAKGRGRIIKKIKKMNINVDEDLLCIVEIADNDPHFKKATKILNKVTSSTLTAIYSADEYDKATWYRLRSTWNPGYPQKESTFPENTYDLSHCCKECYHGLVQNNLFRLKKEYSWKKKHFFMLYWVYDELFTNIETAKILLKNDIKGLEIEDVLIGNQVSQTTKQVKITNTLNFGYIPNTDYCEIEECEVCGNKRYYNNGRQLRFNKSIFEGIKVDIIKTGEDMGSCQNILISKKFYNFIIENKLDDNLVIEPIELV